MAQHVSVRTLLPAEVMHSSLMQSSYLRSLALPRQQLNKVQSNPQEATSSYPAAAGCSWLMRVINVPPRAGQSMTQKQPAQVETSLWPVEMRSLAMMCRS